VLINVYLKVTYPAGDVRVHAEIDTEWHKIGRAFDFPVQHIGSHVVKNLVDVAQCWKVHIAQYI
jgi:hypothetical protein